MSQEKFFDPNARQKAKERARLADENALRSGRISREQLRARNSFLAPLEILESKIRLQGILTD